MRNTAFRFLLVGLRCASVRCIQAPSYAIRARFSGFVAPPRVSDRFSPFPYRGFAAEGSSGSSEEDSGKSTDSATPASSAATEGQEGDDVPAEQGDEGEEGEYEEGEGEYEDEEDFDDEIEDDDLELEYFGVDEEEGEDEEDSAKEMTKLYWDMMKGKLTRGERGDYEENHWFDLVDELEEAPQTPDNNKSLYDLRTFMPELMTPKSPFSKFLEELESEDFNNPDYPTEEPPPFPGARPILRWELRMILHTGPSDKVHPANRKAKCYVYLRDLQEQCNLSDKAVQHIAKICGPRYNPHKGELTLVSEKYQHREDNRRHIMKMLQDLVAEGEKAFPVKQKKQRKKTSAPHDTQQAVEVAATATAAVQSDIGSQHQTMTATAAP